MQRWEQISKLVSGEEKLTAVLSEQGRDGWELVSAVFENPTYRVFFKRPFSDAFHGASGPPR